MPRCSTPSRHTVTTTQKSCASSLNRCSKTRTTEPEKHQTGFTRLTGEQTAPVSSSRNNLLDHVNPVSSDLFAEKQRAQGEEQDRHDDEDEQMGPVFEEMRAAKNDRACE